MQFHKKHGVFEACKKVCEDFFDTLIGYRKTVSRDVIQSDRRGRPVCGRG